MGDWQVPALPNKRFEPTPEVIKRGAGATLLGLMFVATSLAAGIEGRLQTLDAGIEAFNTPTVMHFAAVLVVAGILSAPWQALSSIRLVLGLLSVGLVVYMVIVMQRMRHIPGRQTPLKDWLCGIWPFQWLPTSPCLAQR